MSSRREKGEGSCSGKRLQKTSKKAATSIGQRSGDSDKVEGLNLPPRIFATNRYPPNGRINSYSKPEYLLDLVHALEGTPEFQKIMESPFGCLFQLPVRKCSLSGKLVHNFLSRGLVTEKEHEIWSVFGGYPIRFSLREFAMVTGLPCGPFPSVTEIREMHTTPEGENRYWDTLICSKNAMTVQEIVNLLKRDQRKPVDKKMPGWRRFRLALIVIVEGILICGSHPVRASLEVVEMVRNLDSFMAYPWGRESFELTLRMIKVGSKVENLEALVDKFLQSHTLCHGFPIAIQLLIFRSIPLLEQYIPNGDEETFAESGKVQLSKMKSFHNNNILLSEYDPTVKVESILQTDDPFDESSMLLPTDSEDPAVDYLERLIQEGHKFNMDEWHGGYTGCASMTPPPPKKVGGRLKPCKSYGKKLKNDPQKDDDVDDLLYEIEVINYAHTMEVKKWWGSERTNLKEELKREILQEVLVNGEGVTGKNIGGERRIGEGVGGQDIAGDPSSGEGVGGQDSGGGPSIGDPEPVDKIDENSAPVDKIAIPVDTLLVGEGDKVVDQTDTTSDNLSPTKKVDAVLESLKQSGNLTEDPDATYDQEDESSTETSEKEENVDEKVSETTGVEKSEEHGESDENSSTKEETENEEIGNASDESKEEVSQDVDDEAEETDGSGGKSNGEGGVDVSMAELVPVSPRGAKRAHDPAEGKTCIPDTSRPKRQKVLPTRFRSPASVKRETAIVCVSTESAIYTPFGGVDGKKVKKYLSICQREFVIEGHPVKKSFFQGIYTPRNWVDTTQMEAMLSLVLRKLGDELMSARIAVIDTWFTKTLANEFRSFKKTKRGNSFPWNSLIKNTVRGVVHSRGRNIMWYRDVDLVYAPMNWGKGHWVALAIELKLGKIHILDPLIKANAVKKMNSAMKPIVEMLPSAIKDILSSEGIDFTFPEAFEFERVVNVSQNERTGDCGPLAVKFIELDAQGFDVDDIDDAMVDQLRMKYAVDIYEEFVHTIHV